MDLEKFKVWDERAKKYEYFFLSINLGVLALSIQTLSIDAKYVNLNLLVVSWVLFLLSFLSGMIRQERINIVNSINLHINEAKNNEHSKDYKQIELHFKHGQKAYLLHKWLFIYGLLFYALFKITNILSLSEISIFFIVLTFFFILPISQWIYNREISRIENENMEK